jgi:hypothetical protein
LRTRKFKKKKKDGRRETKKGMEWQKWKERREEALKYTVNHLLGFFNRVHRSCDKSKEKILVSKS